MWLVEKVSDLSKKLISVEKQTEKNTQRSNSSKLPFRIKMEEGRAA